jgi:hypothetical protein
MHVVVVPQLVREELHQLVSTRSWCQLAPVWSAMSGRFLFMELLCGTTRCWVAASWVTGIKTLFVAWMFHTCMGREVAENLDIAGAKMPPPRHSNPAVVGAPTSQRQLQLLPWPARGLDEGC